MKKRLTQKELREILLKNAKVLMSEKYKTEYQEISGEKRKKRNKFLRSICEYDIIKTLVR